MAESDELTRLFDAAQEVVRESFQTALRIADERGVDPRALIRAAFSQTNALGYGMGYGSGTPAKRRPAPKQRGTKKS
jgi:hypothetical protein